MYKILVVDDEIRIRELIAKYAVFEGYDVTESGNGLDAVKLCSENNYDIIIIDVMMPELDGFSTVKEIRKTKSTPVIMLSARGEEYDKIHGFEVGVDDYVVKPFSPKELMMRIDAIMKRANGSRTGQDSDQDLHETFKHEGVELDFTARLVNIGSKRVDLSPKEYDLLFYLVKNRNIALSRDRLLEEVWGYDFHGDDRTLDTHIKMLRRYLGEHSNLIVTLRGVGYRFEG